MSKKGSQKLKLLYLCRYLLRSSDEEHPVTMKEMIAYLAQQDIAAERKSIYDDLEALRVFGLDVQDKRLGSSIGYFIGQRDFQLPELKLLVDSVQSSRFITEKKSLELIGKLESLTSEHEAQALHREVYVPHQGHERVHLLQRGRDTRRHRQGSDHHLSIFRVERGERADLAA